MLDEVVIVKRYINFLITNYSGKLLTAKKWLAQSSEYRQGCC